VFVVGYFGDWRPAAEVLFEPESVRGDPAPGRKAREGVTASVVSGAPVSDYDVAGTLDKGVPRRGIGHNGNYDSQVVSVGSLCARTGQSISVQDATQGHLMAQPIALAENTIGRKPENGGNGDGFTEGGPMYTLNATGVHGVAHPVGFTRCDHGGDAVIDGTLTMRCGSNYSAHLAAAIPNMAVRRLSPKECERLQGFPDGYTDIWLKDKDTPDGPRYKALGNSMAVPVMAWIGKRINNYMCGGKR
jgi:DNA (cytosine-5)-methyltransferase 1